MVVIVYFVYFHRQRKGKVCTSPSLINLTLNKCDVQPLDLYAEPSPLPGGGGAPLMAEFHGAPNVYNQPSDMYSEGPNTYIEVAQSVYNQPSVLYSERPNAYSEVAQSVYNATRNAYPPPPTRPRWYSGHVQSPFTIREGHEYAYGTTAPYSNAMGMTGYTGASYHAETSIPPTPPLQPMSPQPQTLARHSQYTSTSSAFEPYGAPSVSNTPQGVYCWIG